MAEFERGKLVQEIEIQRGVERQPPREQGDLHGGGVVSRSTIVVKSVEESRQC